MTELHREQYEAFFDRHEVCLPYPDEWVPLNLYPDEPLDTAINPAIGVGSWIFCKCSISFEDDHILRNTLIYIRKGQKTALRGYVRLTGSLSAASSLVNLLVNHCRSATDAQQSGLPGRFFMQQLIDSIDRRVINNPRLEIAKRS